MQSAATYCLGADEAERARLLAQCELHRRVQVPRSKSL